MKKRGCALIIAFIIIVVSVVAVYCIKNFRNLTTPPCVEVQPTTPEEPTQVTTNYQDLVFLTDTDKQKIFTAIDSATDAKDFDDKVFTAISGVLDSYNSKSKDYSNFLVAPEIMSDNPGKIEITSHGCKTDLLAGIDITPIKKEDMPALKSFAKLFIEETSRYPLSWWNKAIPPFLVFVKAVKVNGEIVGGVEHGAVIYNIEDISNPDDSKRVIHHELMHWLELSSKTRTDPAWPATPSAYLQKYSLSTDYNFLEHPEAGFVTGYAKTNSQEDKAEIYAYLFTPDRLEKLNQWEKNDLLLKAKVEYLKKFIKQRVDKMDDTYFARYVLNN